MSRMRQIALAVAGTLLCSPSAYAQNATAGQTPTIQSVGATPDTYGTASLVSHVVSAWDFEFATTGTGTTSFVTPGGRYFTSPGILRAGIHLPNGALIQSIEIQGCDLSPTGALTLALSSYGVTSPPTADQVGHGSLISGTTVASTDGCQTWSTPVNVVVNNQSRAYWLAASAGTSDPTNSFHAARVYYRLQVSPTPGTATFADVPVGHGFHRFVEAIVAAGITGGCGGGNYCPDQPVTRGQLAVFLAVSLGLHWPN